MKETIGYEARDGKRFWDRTRCEQYEEELTLVEPIMARLPVRNIGDEEYWQHDKEELLSVKRDLWALVVMRFGESYPSWRNFSADQVYPDSIVGRVLDDFGGPIATAWNRLRRFNFDLCREYEQLYYAINPSKATKCLNEGAAQ